jgi:hypothetical protein
MAKPSDRLPQVARPNPLEAISERCEPHRPLVRLAADATALNVAWRNAPRPIRLVVWSAAIYVGQLLVDKAGLPVLDMLTRLLP